jgi:hypothetical protein
METSTIEAPVVDLDHEEHIEDNDARSYGEMLAERVVCVQLDKKTMRSSGKPVGDSCTLTTCTIGKSS